jgi:hypothetical protein
METRSERAGGAPGLRHGAGCTSTPTWAGSRPDGSWRDRDAALSRLADRPRRLAPPADATIAVDLGTGATGCRR